MTRHSFTKATYCPATMCPLFAIEGSPWTGDKNSVCPEESWNTEITDRRVGCAFYDDRAGKCAGCHEAHSQVSQVVKHGGTLQVGPKQGRAIDTTLREYDCKRADECQWQKSSAELCPPRTALKHGIDPRYCAW